MAVVAALPAAAAAAADWRAWPQLPASDPQVASCPFPRSTDLLGFEYLNGGSADPSALQGPVRAGNQSSADTWYPTQGMNGKIYSSWTDGSVHGVHSGSSTHPKLGAMTGMAIVELPSGGKDFNPEVGVYKLAVQNISVFHSWAAPYEGRYACGSLFYQGTWFFGTYSLDDRGGSGCGGFCVMGPFCGFRWSTDEGKTLVNSTVSSLLYSFICAVWMVLCSYRDTACAL